jgi:hypothetical protein
MRISKLACLATVMASIGSVGCNTLPHQASLSDSTSLYAWTASSCPSDSGARFAVDATLLGDLVSAVVSLPANALTAAAAADKAGYSTSGTSARFFYEAKLVSSNTRKVDQKDAAGTKTYSLTAPGCYIVAYTKPDPQAKKWCDDAPFKAAVPESCAGDRAAIEGLRAKSWPPDLQQQPLALPKFYMEIAFDASGYSSNDATVVLPRLTALYYPRSLLNPTSSEVRHVSLALNLASALSPDPFKAASVSFDIFAKPGPHITPDELTGAVSAWTSLPKVTPPTTLPYVRDFKDQDQKGPYLPLTISASLHEVGDPNAFLAAFASAFASSTSSISSSITNAITPAGIASAQQATDTNNANANSAFASVYTSLVAYNTACAKGPKTEADKQAAEALYYTLLGSIDKARAAGSAANLTPPSVMPPAPCF